MGKLAPVIFDADYVLSALHAIDLLVPETAPMHDFLYEIVATMWELIEGRNVRPSDLERLNAQFFRAADAAASPTS
jgi:hypothetical protein